MGSGNASRFPGARSATVTGVELLEIDESRSGDQAWFMDHPMTDALRIHG